MAKIYGLFGAMTGKVADSVMVVRNGEQIVRKYQPVVSNPATPGQTEARAKLKLMSQLSAVMAPVIAMRRQGAVSSRNVFVKENYGTTTYANNQADITLTNVKLTKSVVSFPTFSVSRTEGEIIIYIPESENPANLGFDRVVYVMFVKDADGSLRYAGSRVVNEPGVSSDWGSGFPADSRECIFYAYGIRDNSETARATFGNLQAVTAETVAKLVVTRTLLESDITLTETRSATLPANPGA